MDPILAEIYSTVLTAAPFVIAAYALLFLILLVYVAFILNEPATTEKKIDALAEHVEELQAK